MEQGQEEKLDVLYYSLEAASTFLNPVPSRSEILASINPATGSSSENGTFLEGSNIYSATRAASLEGYFSSSVSVTDSVKHDDDFDGESLSFELLQLEESNDAENRVDNKLDELIMNRSKDIDSDLFSGETEENVTTNDEVALLRSISISKNDFANKCASGKNANRRMLSNI